MGSVFGVLVAPNAAGGSNFLEPPPARPSMKCFAASSCCGTRNLAPMFALPLQRRQGIARANRPDTYSRARLPNLTQCDLIRPFRDDAPGHQNRCWRKRRARRLLAWLSWSARLRREKWLFSDCHRLKPLTVRFQRDCTLPALLARARNSAMFWSSADHFQHRIA